MFEYSILKYVADVPLFLASVSKTESITYIIKMRSTECRRNVILYQINVALELQLLSLFKFIIKVILYYCDQLTIFILYIWYIYAGILYT